MKPGVSANPALSGPQVAFSNELRRVLVNVLRHGNATNQTLHPQNVLALQQVIQLRKLFARRRLSDANLLFLRRIVQLNEEHKSVELRLR